MAEMLIQSESLTAIADKIRVLSGTSGAMGLDAMATHVNTANSNVSTEAGLIAQIQSALEGKAAGGGSGGESVETCTVSIVNEDWMLCRLIYYDSTDEKHDYYDENGMGEIEFPTSITVKKGESIVVEYADTNNEPQCTGCEIIYNNNVGAGALYHCAIIKIMDINATIVVR